MGLVIKMRENKDYSLIKKMGKERQDDLGEIKDGN